MTLDTILDNFEFLDDWEDKYRYVIELGRALPEFPAESQNDINKVEGCVSQVWLIKTISKDEDDPVITYQGDSDAHIVKGLVAIVLAAFSGKRASAIQAFDTNAMFKQIGLNEHLTPQRSNGLNSMVQRIKADATSILAS